MKRLLGANLIFTVISVGTYLSLDPAQQERAIYFLLGALAAVWLDWIWIPTVRKAGRAIENYFKR